MQTGVEAWFERQLSPAAIRDDAAEKRLRDFPTLAMSPEQALLRFPNRSGVERVAKGQMPYPTDPLLASLYEVQVFKYNDDLVRNKVDASGKKAYEPSGAELAAAKKAGQGWAAQIAGDLFACPPISAWAR